MNIKMVKRIINSKFQLFMSKLLNSKNISLGKGVHVRSRFFSNINGGKLTIGNNVFFNNDCSINCQGQIIIGDNCIFGENVKIYDHNHIFSDLNKPISGQGMKVGRIKIGKNCWIGSNVVILTNVEIGNNVVIGANCLIHKSVPSDSLVKCNSELIVESR